MQGRAAGAAASADALVAVPPGEGKGSPGTGPPARFQQRPPSRRRGERGGDHHHPTQPGQAAGLADSDRQAPAAARPRQRGRRRGSATRNGGQRGGKGRGAATRRAKRSQPEREGASGRVKQEMAEGRERKTRGREGEGAPQQGSGCKKKKNTVAVSLPRTLPQQRRGWRGWRGGAPACPQHPLSLAGRSRRQRGPPPPSSQTPLRLLGATRVSGGCWRAQAVVVALQSPVSLPPVARAKAPARFKSLSGGPSGMMLKSDTSDMRRPRGVSQVANGSAISQLLQLDWPVKQSPVIRKTGRQPHDRMQCLRPSRRRIILRCSDFPSLLQLEERTLDGHVEGFHDADASRVTLLLGEAPSTGLIPGWHSHSLRLTWYRRPPGAP